MNREYMIAFNIDAPCKELDKFALLACQGYNLGNSTDWFGSFRGGLFAFHWRVFGVNRHFQEVHAWVPRPRNLAEAEYHLASIFFHMDSALECFVFALNALGNSAAPNDFRDITSESALRQIAPSDITGTAKRPPLPGYRAFFPTLQAEWNTQATLLAIIVDQHDVSKHRETIFVGGQMRMYRPPGFFENLGIQNNPTAQAFFSPMGEIILKRDPKRPRARRGAQQQSSQVLLEDICNDFCAFINRSCELALADAKANITLVHSHFLNGKA